MAQSSQLSTHGVVSYCLLQCFHSSLTNALSEPNSALTFAQMQNLSRVQHSSSAVLEQRVRIITLKVIFSLLSMDVFESSSNKYETDKILNSV